MLTLSKTHKWTVPTICFLLPPYFSTYDHRTLKTRLPVRSALFKQRTGGLVVRWVTTGESPLLYVFALSLLDVDDTQKEDVQFFYPFLLLLLR
jgi:hypothetical protein